MPFEFLPKQDKCCLCINDIKIASIIIGIWYMICAVLNLDLARTNNQFSCTDFYNGDGASVVLVSIWRYVLMLVSILFVISIIGFFTISCCGLQKPILVDIFTVMIPIIAITKLIYFTLCIIRLRHGNELCNKSPLPNPTPEEQNMRDAENAAPTVILVGSILFMILDAYYAIIINSFSMEL